MFSISSFKWMSALQMVAFLLKLHIKQDLEEEVDGLPEAESLLNDDKPILYYIIEDYVFPLRTCLMKPQGASSRLLQHWTTSRNYHQSAGGRARLIYGRCRHVIVKAHVLFVAVRRRTAR